MLLGKIIINFKFNKELTIHNKPHTEKHLQSPEIKFLEL